MRPDTVTLAIEEKYTLEERANIADKLAIAVAELEVITGEKKVSDAAFNERIKRTDGKITTLAKQYNKGCEVAQIGCDIRYDNPEIGKKSYYRMDRSELVETHDMSWEEKQETIQFPLTESKSVCTCTHTRDQHDEDPPYECGAEILGEPCFCVAYTEKSAATIPPPDDLEKAMGISGEPSEPLMPPIIPPRITEVPPEEPPTPF